MSALADIREALAVMPRIETGWRRWIVVGPSAGRSMSADEWRKSGGKDWDATVSWERRLPQSIGGFAVLTTDQFDGWSIVDRPRSALESTVAATA